MSNVLKVSPLEREGGEQFLSFLNGDGVRHVFTIYDLKHDRDKTRVWIAREDNEISGYLFEFDRRIIHTHGTVESVARLMRHIDLKEPTLVIEPHHLPVVETFFEPVEPTDAASKGRITTYLVMKANGKSFKPLIRHKVKKLGAEDLKRVSESFGEEWAERINNTIKRGVAYGAYEGDTLASTATTSEMLDRIALIRGVFTVPKFRGKGLATSAVSALVQEIIALDKDAVLWVAEDNFSARRVYEKLGFQRTENILLGFKARRL